MIFTLILLVLLLLSAVAMIRSFGTSLTMAGNIGFKRDLANQGERAMAKAISAFNSGALATSKAREADLPSGNYYAAQLGSDSHGVPLMLIKDSLFAGTGGDIVDNDSGVTMRWVVDRLCHSPGAFNPSTCVSVKLSNAKGGSSWQVNQKVGREYQPVYRVSVRVTGPRNTQTYLQTTFTR